MERVAVQQAGAAEWEDRGAENIAICEQEALKIPLKNRKVFDRLMQ